MASVGITEGCSSVYAIAIWTANEEEEPATSEGEVKMLYERWIGDDRQRDEEGI